MSDGLFSNSKYLNESICLNKTTVDTSILVLFPPLWVYLDQKKKKKSNFSKFMVVLISIILTGFFYLPGLLHALYIMSNNTETAMEDIYDESMYTKSENKKKNNKKKNNKKKSKKKSKKKKKKKKKKKR